MILKKPYALLIKQFRIIHLLLFGSIFYVFLQTDSIIKIFGELVSSGKISTFSNTSWLIYLLVIIIIIFCFSMFLLMKYKKKPINFYLSALFYYLFFLIMLYVANNIIYKSSMAGVIDIKVARAYYDLARIFYYPQLFFLFYSFIRGIGFDIKKFDFNQDLEELDIDKQDSEEFEFVLGIDYHDYLKKIRRYIRELKYYFLENHTIIISILVIVSLITSLLFFYKREVVDKIYKENQMFSVKGIQYTITDSIVTNLDKIGDKIYKDYYYLVLNINLKNTSSKSQKIDPNDFDLITRTNVYTIDNSQNNYFADLGIQYRGEYLPSNENVNRLFAFKMDNYIPSDKYQLNILESFVYDEKTNQNNPKYTKINLKPTNYINIVNNDPKYFGTKIVFENSTLKNSSLNITDFKIQDSFIYKYEYCFKPDDCRDLDGVVSSNSGGGATTLLILDYELRLDKNSTYMSVNDDQFSFFQDFIKVDFIINDQRYHSKVKIKNMDRYRDYLILEVSSKIKNANKIEFIVSIRDQKYVIYLK